MTFVVRVTSTYTGEFVAWHNFPGFGFTCQKCENGWQDKRMVRATPT
jgi:hypothetical protein